jgi:hypothetical protein
MARGEPGPLTLLLIEKMGFHEPLKEKPEPEVKRCHSPPTGPKPGAAGAFWEPSKGLN